MITTAFSNILFVSMLSIFSPGNPIQPIDLVNTKWISPATDSCSEMLCFNSEQTVMLKRCDDDWSYEIGYKISNGKIEIEAYTKGGMPESKLILYEDHGVLRQDETQVNSFPKIYVQVPGGKCE